jgi:integrase
VGAGLRPAEICGLRWDDVNFEAGTVWPKRNVVPRSSEMGGGLQVWQTKTEFSAAAVHVMPAVLRMLEAYPATCPDTRLWRLGLPFAAQGRPSSLRQLVRLLPPDSGPLSAITEIRDM